MIQKTKNIIGLQKIEKYQWISLVLFRNQRRYLVEIKMLGNNEFLDINILKMKMHFKDLLAFDQETHNIQNLKEVIKSILEMKVFIVRVIKIEQKVIAHISKQLKLSKMMTQYAHLKNQELRKIVLKILIPYLSALHLEQ